MPHRDRAEKRDQLPVALIPAVAVLGFAVLAAGPTFGWSDVLWLAWAGIFAIFEGNAILSEAEGDTLSERLRVWYRTKSKAGRVGFAASVAALALWLVPHILGG